MISNKNRRVSVTMSKEDYNFMKEVCKEKDVTMSFFMQDLLKRYLQDIRGQQKIKVEN